MRSTHVLNAEPNVIRRSVGPREGCAGVLLRDMHVRDGGGAWGIMVSGYGSTGIRLGSFSATRTGRDATGFCSLLNLFPDLECLVDSGGWRLSFNVTSSRAYEKRGVAYRDRRDLGLECVVLNSPSLR